MIIENTNLLNQQTTKALNSPNIAVTIYWTEKIQN